jgi:hypothetical protein
MSSKQASDGGETAATLRQDGFDSWEISSSAKLRRRLLMMS